VFLVHGEPAAQDALRAVLKEQLGVEARSPVRGDSAELGGG